MKPKTPTTFEEGRNKKTKPKRNPKGNRKNCWLLLKMKTCCVWYTMTDGEGIKRGKKKKETLRGKG